MLNRKRPRTARAPGKISEWKEVVFRAGGQRGCPGACELRPCSPAQKARRRLLSPLSSRYLVRNSGAGRRPGTDPHTLSRHPCPSPPHPSPPAPGGRTDGRAHSPKGSAPGKFSHFASVSVPGGFTKDTEERGRSGEEQAGPGPREAGGRHRGSRRRGSDPPAPSLLLGSSNAPAWKWGTRCPGKPGLPPAYNPPSLAVCLRSLLAMDCRPPMPWWGRVCRGVVV